jgi:hypothetical protein
MVHPIYITGYRAQEHSPAVGSKTKIQFFRRTRLKNLVHLTLAAEASALLASALLAAWHE